MPENDAQKAHLQERLWTTPAKRQKTWIVKEIPVEIWQLSVYIATIGIGGRLMFKSVNDVNNG